MQIRVFLLEDADKVDEVTASRQVGAFYEVATRHGCGAAQMHKVVRDANFLASSRVSLCSPALSEPAQNVSPLCGLSTAFRNQAMSSSLVTIRGKPGNLERAGRRDVRTYLRRTPRTPA